MAFRKIKLDPKGYYLIRIKNNKIEAGLFSYHKKLLKLYTGKVADTIVHKIIDDKNVTLMDHAAYLGRELTKAEIAMKLKMKYVQDDPLKI